MENKATVEEQLRQCLQERQALTRELVILNDLAYITECMALTFTGKAKSEICALRSRLEEIEDPEEGERYVNLYTSLDEIESCLYELDLHKAAGHLSSISRSLWHHILPMG